eukprot:g14736.t1
MLRAGGYALRYHFFTLCGNFPNIMYPRHAGHRGGKTPIRPNLQEPVAVSNDPNLKALSLDLSRKSFLPRWHNSFRKD